MRRNAYDLAIVGGGLAGASLATVMARAGARVLVLEREPRFRERIRGEGMHPWGVAEARTLGILEPLLERCGHPVRWRATYMDGTPRPRRDQPATNPYGTPSLDYVHPEMQETLLDVAQQAGAEVRRGTRVMTVRPGAGPVVVVEHNGGREEVGVRLVVGADGRSSAMRAWGGFAVRRDPDFNRISGLLFRDIPGDVDDDAHHLFFPSCLGHYAVLLPLGHGRLRAYFCTARREEHPPVSGSRDIERFIEYCTGCGVPAAWFAGAEVCGPLATFEAAASWVEHPARDGVVLIGDAAGTADPCYGCGQSLTLRDVRVLRDCLLENDDWNAAADRYAGEHDRYFGALHTIESWFSRALFDITPARATLREHAAAALVAGVAPDFSGLGPDAPADEAARRRFLGV